MGVKIQQAGQAARPLVVGPTQQGGLTCRAQGIDAVSQAMAGDGAGSGSEEAWHAKLPHEMDEHTSSQLGNRDRRVRRAYQDLHHGRVDTDGRDGLTGVWLFGLLLR